jgi:hypothetical protein
MSVRRVFLASILAAGFAASAHAQCDTRFTLVNNSSDTIQEFYFGSSAQSNWGRDQLGQNVLPVGRSMNFSTRYAGANDFKVVWAGGATAQLMGVNICTTQQIVATRSGIVAR